MTYAPDDAGYRHLFGVAYRLLGSADDAEDAIQETQIRWQQLPDRDRALIREPLAWQTRVLSRICLDQLGSARARREQYAGIWLPELVPGTLDVLVSDGTAAAARDPADAVTRDESVSSALLLVMEQLSPAERVALVLHDVFGLPFAEIAAIVDRSPDATRQLASTARRHLRARPRYAPTGPERDRVVAAFAAACLGGDVHALARVLAPDVVSRGDGGGVIPAGTRPIHGAERVSRLLLGLMRNGLPPGAELAWWLAPVNGETGIVVADRGTVFAVISVAVRDGQIAELAAVAAPDKLRRWQGLPRPASPDATGTPVSG
ncbi:MAG TPA: RNA polymerase sigma factor SigJ [Thermomicrobiales bacterium]|jgi:RNA polymerase sigma-70 factor (ECF subfamily)|nr:RNA polymerase sigma factor SigJ [Thermomicrobiales bacterium]